MSDGLENPWAQPTAVDTHNAAEFIPGRLYFAVLSSDAKQLPRDTGLQHFFRTDNILTYTPFQNDFGPLNISKIHYFCELLRDKLANAELRHKRIYFVSPSHREALTNAALLICSYAILEIGDTPELAYARIQNIKSKLVPYRHAGAKPSNFTISLLETLQALHKALRFRLYEPNVFTVPSYEHYEQLRHGDMNWIVARKLLAFSSPHGTREQADGYSVSVPSDYVGYFREHGVTDIVRLNDATYSPDAFANHGFRLHDLLFEDGSVPPRQIVDQFLQICDRAHGAVAVHCRAGLGRTGTLCALRLMQKYKFTAQEAIAWTRLCRPGSVMGPQQQYLLNIQDDIWRGHLPNPRSDVHLDQLAFWVRSMSLGPPQGPSPKSASMPVLNSTTASAPYASSSSTSAPSLLGVGVGGRAQTSQGSSSSRVVAPPFLRSGSASSSTSGAESSSTGGSLSRLDTVGRGGRSSAQGRGRATAYTSATGSVPVMPSRAQGSDTTRRHASSSAVQCPFPHIQSARTEEGYIPYGEQVRLAQQRVVKEQLRDQQQFLQVRERLEQLRVAEAAQAMAVRSATVSGEPLSSQDKASEHETESQAQVLGSVAASTTSAPAGSSSAQSTPPTPRRGSSSASTRAMKLDMYSDEQTPADAISSIRRSRSNSQGHAAVAMLLGRGRANSHGHSILAGGAAGANRARTLGSASAEAYYNDVHGSAGEDAAERLLRDGASDMLCDTPSTSSLGIRSVSIDSRSEAAVKGQTPPTPRAAQRRGMRSLIPSMSANGRS